MAVKSPQFEINIRKNDNALSEAYGKYYPKAVEKQTISLRGLCNHMAEHNSIYGRDIIQGVLMKMSGCIVELLSQGNPVKIDGLGTFVPTVESEKSGISKADLIAGKWNPQTYVKAIHIRFRPENTTDDKITSRSFKSLCALTTIGVEEKVDLTPDEQDKQKKEFIKRVTPLDSWIAEQLNATGGSQSGDTGNGSTDSGNSGSQSGSGSENSGSENSGSQNSGSEQQQNTLAKPTIYGVTPFTESTEVTMSGPEDAEIRYTTDGSTPSAQSTLYEGGFTLSDTTTVKAIAIKNGESSEVSTRLFSKGTGGDTGGNGDME